MQLQAGLASEQHGIKPLQANLPAKSGALLCCCSSGRRSSAIASFRPEGLVSRSRPDHRQCRIHSTAQETTTSPKAEHKMLSPMEFIRSLGTDKVAHSGEARHNELGKLYAEPTGGPPDLRIMEFSSRSDRTSL